jgi:hypothetical protein
MSTIQDSNGSPDPKKRRVIRRSLVALLLVLAAALAACNPNDLFDALEGLMLMMEPPQPEVGMTLGSGG